MKFYRYADESTTSGIEIYLHEKILLKETPCGYWLTYPGSKKRYGWVSKKGKRRKYATTKEEALRNFMARKKRQIEILESRLEQAHSALKQAKAVVCSCTRKPAMDKKGGEE